MKFLKNKTAWKRWHKREYIDDPNEPKEYPCFAQSLIAADESGYALYWYRHDLELLLKELGDP